MIDKQDIKLWPASFMPWQSGAEPDRQIAVLASGGVDSSVTAWLLKKQGWDVLGITMKIPISCRTGKRPCCGTDAASVCKQLDIPHYFADVTRPFMELIIEPFRRCYAQGRTPNPCVDCNTFLKFSLLWDFLEQAFNIKHLATGHYAKISKTNGRTYLGRATDKGKDQSYFLHGITSERLDRLVLPLGEFTKEKVRSIASELNLPVAQKPESMELCFTGQGDYRHALADVAAGQDGDITDMQGRKIGTHKGIANYTLGQRRGIGFAGGRPLYVGSIDAGTNTIALGTREEVSCRSVRVEGVNVLIPEELIAGAGLFGKVRSYSDPQPCRVIEIDNSGMAVEFDRVQFAPCPGQRLVLYNGDDNIVAGGTITASGRG